MKMPTLEEKKNVSLPLLTLSFAHRSVAEFYKVVAYFVEENRTESKKSGIRRRKKNAGIKILFVVVSRELTNVLNGNGAVWLY